MSTRIYKGFLIETDSLSAIMGVVNGFRPWVVKQAERKMDAFIRVLTDSGMDYREAYRTWGARREALAKTMVRDPVVDTEFSLSFLPEPPGGHCLGIVYTEDAAWHRKWLRQPGVRQYGYWDNSDKPSHITSREWRERGEAWSSVLPGSAPVVMQSFSLDLMGPHNPWPKAARPKKGKHNEKF